MSTQRPVFKRPRGNDDLYPRGAGADCGGRAEPEAVGAADADSHTTFLYNRHHHLPIEAQRQRLPIFEYRNHILYLLERFQTLVLVGETGCGKSTQVPQYLADAGHVVCVTVPRATAAAALASRVRAERGGAVGCAGGMRSSRAADDDIVYMTEGVLLREMMASPLLTQYSCVVLDEVHERTQLTDVLMGLLKKIAKRRKKLKLVISSATQNVEYMRRFFDTGAGVAALAVRGRLHPVRLFYMREPVPDYVKGAVETAIKIHETKPFGDVLAFLTSQEEITCAVECLQRYAEDSQYRNKYKLMPLPMYGSLSHHRQLKVFQMADRDVRKVVVATNIAETSVTIPGINYVIDCGFHKLPYYSPSLAVDTISACPVSKANATQRAGRAGRTAPGECYRLYTEAEYDKMADSVPPEIERSELSSTLLQLKALGIHNLLTFSFPTPPPARNVLAGLETLLALEAVERDEIGTLTSPLGKQMAELPLYPALGRMLCRSAEFGCLEEALSMVAMLHVDGVFSDPRGAEASKARISRRNRFEVAEGDLMMYLNVYAAYSAVGADASEKQRVGMRRTWCRKHYVNHAVMEKVEEVRRSLDRLAKQKFQLQNQTFDGLEFCSAKTVRLLRCITSGLFMNAARLTSTGGSGAYRTVSRNTPLDISPQSCLHQTSSPQWVVFVSVQCSGDRNYMRDVTAIDKEWLMELAPHYYKQL